AELGGPSSTPTLHTATILFSAVPHTATLSTPTQAAISENQAAVTLTSLSLTTVGPANDAPDTYNVTLSVLDGTLALQETVGLTGSFSGSTMGFHGTLSAANLSLPTATYPLP